MQAMKRVISTIIAYMLALAPALATAIGPFPAMATGPATVTFPNSVPYGVTLGSGGEYHSTTALVDINNPANGATISGGSLQVTVQNSPAVTISGTPAVSVSGTANVACVSGCGGGAGGTAAADESAFTQGTTSLTPIGGLFSSSIANLTSGQTGIVQLTADRMMVTNLGKVGGAAVALGQTTMAASLPVAIASNQGNVPINNAQVSGTAVDTNSGNKSAGTQRIVIATDQPSLTNPLSVSSALSASGGCTPYHLAGGSAASTNSTLIITGQHVLCSLTLVNVSSTVGFFRLYDSSGAPTCSSATGAQETIPVPQAANAGGGVAVPLAAVGTQFASGIGYCITGGGADTDNTSGPTGIYIVASFK
jgi:hypothetical protein